MSHFAAIGLPAGTEREMQDSVTRAVERAGTPRGLDPRQHGHAWFEDGSGAALGVAFDEHGNVACVTPYFVAPGGPTRWRVRTRAAQLDRECVHCSGADCDVADRASGELVTRATIQWAMFTPYRKWLGGERDFELEVVGFASTLYTCDTPDDLERAQADYFGGEPGEGGPAASPGDPAGAGGGGEDGGPRRVRLAESAFLPYGMFDHEGDLGQRARAVLTGAVTSFARPTNALTGARFAHLRVNTLAGELDVVAPDALVAGAGAGVAPRLVLADVWLVGRPTDPPPIGELARKSWWRRLGGGTS